LAFPKPELEFILDTDASDTGMGAVLSQIQEGNERVIAYASKSLGKAEKKYCVTRKELLAVVYFIKYFKHYLLGRKFTVRSDHGALRWLFNFKEPEGQLARWMETLAMFEFEIKHRPGRQHNNADGLSRLPCRQCGRKDEITVNAMITKTNLEKVNHDLPCFQRWSSEELAEKQKGDPILGIIFAWKEKNEKPEWATIAAESQEVKTYWNSWEQISLNEGVLFKCMQDACLGEVLRLLVPKMM
jgi:hypothetical protein